MRSTFFDTFDSGMIDDERAALAHRAPDGVVGLEVAEIVDVEPEAAATGRLELRAQIEIGARARLVDHDARAVAVDLVEHAAGDLRVAVLDRVVEIERRGHAAFEGAIDGQLVDLLDVTQTPQKRRFDEAEGVLDAGGLGHHHQDADVRHQEEVERDEAGAGRQIADEVVGVDLAHLVDEAVLGGRARIGGPQRIAFAGDEAEPLDRRLDYAILDARDPLVEEVAERDLGALDADEGVQVGAAEIGVDEDDAFSQLRQVDAEVGGEQRLSDAALAPADGDDAPAAGTFVRRRRVLRPPLLQLVWLGHGTRVSRVGARAKGSERVGGDGDDEPEEREQRQHEARGWNLGHVGAAIASCVPEVGVRNLGQL